MKPALDRLENDLQGRAVVRRVDIQSVDGKHLVAEYRIDFTPTFIFFGAEGKEQWRSVGQRDGAQIRRLAMRGG